MNLRCWLSNQNAPNVGKSLTATTCHRTASLKKFKVSIIVSKLSFISSLVKSNWHPSVILILKRIILHAILRIDINNWQNMLNVQHPWQSIKLFRFFNCEDRQTPKDVKTYKKAAFDTVKTRLSRCGRGVYNKKNFPLKSKSETGTKQLQTRLSWVDYCKVTESDFISQLVQNKSFNGIRVIVMITQS